MLAVCGVLGRAGACIDERVMFAARKSPIGIAVAFACFRIGATFVPVDWNAPPERLKAMISAVKPVVVITDSTSVAKQTSDVGKPFLSVNQLAKALGADNCLEPAVYDPQRVAYMMFTSGSNGVPKAVAIPWAALSTFFEDIAEHYSISAGARCLNTSPSYFDVSILDTWYPLFQGASVRITQPEELFPPRFLFLLSSEAIEYMCCVAPQLKLVAQCGSLMNHFDLSSLHTVMTGAESPDPASLKRWISCAPQLHFINGYGPTEATCVCTAYHITRDNVDFPEPYPIGIPLRRTECALSVDGKNVSTSQSEGELWLAGPQIMAFYYGDPEQTASKVVSAGGQRYYRSGDRVRRNCRGELTYLGRVDDEVKVAGHRIDLGELTAVANHHPRVEESFATAFESNDNGFWYLVLAFTCKDGDRETVAEELRRSLAELLPKYMQPKHVYAVEEFPHLGSGKLDKQSLCLKLEKRATSSSS